MLKTVINNFAAHFGIKCSSLCRVNKGTSMRSACSSEGYVGHVSVLISNKLLDRTCALVLLCTALGGAWSLEQPSGSLLEYFPTWTYVMRKIFDNGGPQAVHIVRWWMKHYGSRTSKRHMGFANSPAIRRLDLGRLQVSKGPAPKTCVKYHDRQGRLKYKGTKHLKATEIYPMKFARAVLDLVEPLKQGARGQPSLPDGGAPPALYTMTQFEWPVPAGLWKYADFAETFNYLRGSKRLVIPEEWRDVVPRKMKNSFSDGDSIGDV